MPCVSVFDENLRIQLSSTFGLIVQNRKKEQEIACQAHPSVDPIEQKQDLEV